jgi:hypothetical protein
MHLFNGKSNHVVFFAFRSRFGKTSPRALLYFTLRAPLHSETKAFVKWNCHQSFIYLKWQLTFERSSSGLRGRRRTYPTILKMAWSANFKMVWYVLLRPLTPEIRSAVTSNYIVVAAEIAGGHTLPFKKGMVCQFLNGMVNPHATSEAGARRPRSSANYSDSSTKL